MSVNVSIIVGKDEPIEKALRRFKRACEKAGIKKEAKARERYEKPSDAKRREIRRAERNRRKLQKAGEQEKKHQRSRNWMLDPSKELED